MYRKEQARVPGAVFGEFLCKYFTAAPRGRTQICVLTLILARQTSTPGATAASKATSCYRTLQNAERLARRNAKSAESSPN